MKKLFVAGLMLIFVLPEAFAQKTNQVIMDPILHREVMAGVCTRSGLENNIFSQWFNTEHKNYHPKSTLIKTIAKKVNKTTITVIFGSWCGDSKMQVGRFFKILDNAGFNDNQLKIVAVSRSLKAGDMNISKLHVQRVPAFIVYYHGNEIGRIVESPRVSLEADLATILKKIK